MSPATTDTARSLKMETTTHRRSARGYKLLAALFLAATIATAWQCAHFALVPHDPLRVFVASVTLERGDYVAFIGLASMFFSVMVLGALWLLYSASCAIAKAEEHGCATDHGEA